jgi:dienelactone hydrolase
MRFAALFLLLALVVVAGRAGVVGKEVEYSADGVTLKGYIAYNDAVKGARPGIIVVHEWWGNNAYSHKRADMLAGLGYVALAVDMYGDGKQATDPKAAGAMSGGVMKDPAVLKARFMAGLNELKSQTVVDTARIGAIGYCFGGGVVLAAARMGADLKGVVSFHGMLGTQSPAAPGSVKARMLVCNGADDKFISADDIAKFKKEMKDAGVDMTFINYAGSVHSFTNPASTENGKKYDMPLAYNEKADKKSWTDMKEFFAKVFKQ